DAREAGALVVVRDIRVELAAALDGWVAVLRAEGRNVWRDRLAAARAADPDPFRDRVREAVARGDRKALEVLAAVDEVTDLPPPTLALMAQVLRGLRARDQSLALVTKAQRRHPGDFWVNYNLAILFETMGPTSNDDAIRYSAMALALRPQSPAAHFKLGRALLVKGRLDEGIAELRESIRLQDSALARLVLGQALVNQGRLDKALVKK